jgi:hypothetical protein
VELEHKKLDLQKEKLKLQADEAKRGQIFGLIIGIFAILSGSVTSIMGAPMSGGVLVAEV